MAATGVQRRTTRCSTRLISSPVPSYAETDSDSETSSFGDQWRRKKRSGKGRGRPNKNNSKLSRQTDSNPSPPIASRTRLKTKSPKVQPTRTRRPQLNVDRNLSPLEVTQSVNRRPARQSRSPTRPPLIQIRLNSTEELDLVGMDIRDLTRQTSQTSRTTPIRPTPIYTNRDVGPFRPVPQPHVEIPTIPVPSNQIQNQTANQNYSDSAFHHRYNVDCNCAQCVHFFMSYLRMAYYPYPVTLPENIQPTVPQNSIPAEILPVVVNPPEIPRNPQEAPRTPQNSSQSVPVNGPADPPQIPPRNSPNEDPPSSDNTDSDRGSNPPNLENSLPLNHPEDEVSKTYWPLFRTIRCLGTQLEKQPELYEAGISHLEKVLEVVGNGHNKLWLPRRGRGGVEGEVRGDGGGSGACAGGAGN